MNDWPASEFISDRDSCPRGTLVQRFDVRSYNTTGSEVGIVMKVTSPHHDADHDFKAVGEFNYGIKVLWVKDGNSVITTELPWRVRRLQKYER